MNTKNYSFYLLLCIIWVSCSKDGAIGPQGPQGQQGNTGNNGVANISIRIFTIGQGQWSNIGGGEFEYGYIDSAITNADSDAVEVFDQEEVDPNAYTPLPYSNFYASGDLLTYDYAIHGVDIFYFYSYAPNFPVTIKIVVIPPAIMIKHPNTNWRDYGEVSTIFNSQKVE